MGNINRHLKFARTEPAIGSGLERFRDSLAERKVSRSTKNQYNYAIKAYYAMLGEKIEVKCLEPNNQIQHYFDSQEVITIFSVIHNLKHLAMLQTLFYEALRASEICNLDMSDVDLKNLELRINNGKRGKDTISLINVLRHLGGILKQAFSHYLRQRTLILYGIRAEVAYSENQLLGGLNNIKDPVFEWAKE